MSLVKIGQNKCFVKICVITIFSLNSKKQGLYKQTVCSYEPIFFYLYRCLYHQQPNIYKSNNINHFFSRFSFFRIHRLIEQSCGQMVESFGYNDHNGRLEETRKSCQRRPTKFTYAPNSHRVSEYYEIFPFGPTNLVAYSIDF